MADFTQTGSGTISISGKAAPVTITIFAIGTKAYVLEKAIIGLLEAVVVKKINRVEVNDSSYRGALVDILSITNYVDTTNRVWLEEELVSLDDALSIINA